MSKKKDVKKKSSKKEKYMKFLAGKDERIAARTRVPERNVPQSLINENDETISQQMRRLPRNKEPENKKRK